ncbi:MAG TPA: hypothetical protein VJ783_03025 [Pirellulales bacterium]|nr:hypothetical protein [Pirellulales bacterium]
MPFKPFITLTLFWFVLAARRPPLAAERDFKSFDDTTVATAPPHGNLDIGSRRFAIVKAIEARRRRVTLLGDGETEPREWRLRSDAEVWRDGWWGRLDQFKEGERVWIWFDTDDAKQPTTISLLADETSQQAFYAPDKDDEVQAAIEKRRAAQQALLRKRWSEEGLPATLIVFSPQHHEVEIMVDHETAAWARSLKAEDRVTIEAERSTPAVVRRLRPWRERTQLVLEADLAAMPGERLNVRLASPPKLGDDDLPAGIGKSQEPAERLEWLMSSIYCTCGMHDGCAGHFYTLAACNAGDEKPCGLAKQTRQQLAKMIDKGLSDQQIVEQLLRERGSDLLRPHMLP